MTVPSSAFGAVSPTGSRWLGAQRRQFALISGHLVPRPMNRQPTALSAGQGQTIAGDRGVDSGPRRRHSMGTHTAVSAAHAGMLISIRALSHLRGSGTRAYGVALPRLDLDYGETVAISGASGTGKSTLLEVLALATPPRACERFELRPRGADPMSIQGLWQSGAKRQLAALRASALGFVLQRGGLLPYLSTRDNIGLGRRLLGLSPMTPEVEEMIERLRLGPLLSHRPDQLSVGEYQRAAVVRALAHRPDLVLADEPTSALDPTLALEVAEVLRQCVRDSGAALILATHDTRLLEALGLRQLHAAPRVGGTPRGAVFVDSPGVP